MACMRFALLLRGPNSSEIQHLRTTSFSSRTCDRSVARRSCRGRGEWPRQRVPSVEERRPSAPPSPRHVPLHLTHICPGKPGPGLVGQTAQRVVCAAQLRKSTHEVRRVGHVDTLVDKTGTSCRVAEEDESFQLFVLGRRRQDLEGQGEMAIPLLVASRHEPACSSTWASQSRSRRGGRQWPSRRCPGRGTCLSPLTSPLPWFAGTSGRPSSQSPGKAGCSG